MKNSKSLKSALNEGGYVNVDKQTLEVVGHPNIYALGDIADLPGQKTLAKTTRQASVVATNIVNTITHKPGKGEKINYKSVFEGIIITNGEVSAVKMKRKFDILQRLLPIFRTGELVLWIMYGVRSLAISLCLW